MQDVKLVQGQNLQTLETRAEKADRRSYIHLAFVFGFATALTILSFVVQPFGSICVLSSLPSGAASGPATITLIRRAATPLLQVFQVYPPILTPTSQGSALGYGSPRISDTLARGAVSGCVVEQVLMDHVFGYSYGMPFVGTRSQRPTRVLLLNREKAYTLLRQSVISIVQLSISPLHRGADNSTG